MPMTTEAKRELSSTIRSLRARLLSDLHDATESAYRLSVHEREAGLSEAARARRKRLDDWVKEQERAEAGRVRSKRTKGDIRRDAEKQAAYTLLNRLIFLRLLEAAELRKPAVATGGWESRGYKDFRSLAPALVRGDETEGYDFLLRLVFEDLATELPGLYGHAGVAELIPIPAATLRHVVESLDVQALASCWTDDMTLGWVYQYWNDPEREALDAKLNAGGKLAPHEIASKTQMFTERYMAEWLLQNSLGPMWLAICKKQGWTPEVETDGTLTRLEQGRIEWRARRESGEVSLIELMPLQTEAERRWAYYLPQPIPEDAVEHALDSIRDLKAIDPAVGSGHFLVILFDLLLALYREEARHRDEESQERWSARAIVESILENNLHGIDLDPRAVQIAAAALWLKAKLACPDAKPARLNLVASNLRLASLQDDDHALVELRREVERETGIPTQLTDTIVRALQGADHLGSLLKVDAAVDEAIRNHETVFRGVGDAVQGLLFDEPPPQQQRLALDRIAARASMLERLEGFLARHTGGDDLGLRLRGEQLAAGVRFVRMLREGTYDLVTGNPPYQGTSKMEYVGYVTGHYERGKANLYAAFLERGLQLVREGGTSALLTMRNWLFTKQFEDIRSSIVTQHDLRMIGDFAIGAFDEVPNDVLSVAVSVIRKCPPASQASRVLQPTPLRDRSYDRERTRRKRAATLAGVGSCDFLVEAVKKVPGQPITYWWSALDFDQYSRHGSISEHHRVAQGISTANDPRFIRYVWEVRRDEVAAWNEDFRHDLVHHVPLIKGAVWHDWIEPLTFVIRWAPSALGIRTNRGSAFRSSDTHFAPGIACTAIGSDFRARAHRYRSVCHNKGTSVFDFEGPHRVCSLSSGRMSFFLESLNPGLGFEVGDIERAPDLREPDEEAVFCRVGEAFSEHEAHREPSAEFRRPGASPWRHAQAWAQSAVDRPDCTPLPLYQPEYDPEPATDHLSYALGVSLGRFGSNGQGILDSAKDDLSHALPSSILFLDGTLESNDLRDSLGHQASSPILATWKERGSAINEGATLRDYLSTKFFEDVHRKMYESRPIHWPLSSEKKTFVAWVTIHRWNENTLRVLLADHLGEALKRLDGEVEDLRAVREGADKRAAREAEKRYAKVQKWREELVSFIAAVEQCAEQGPPPTDAACPAREANARYVPDLDDGVMLNSAALWPLLLPQWKEPKKWWKELATAQGKKDYDWSHLAMRYWPTRVDGKCQADPSLGVAHGCFWKYHPARAWAWELRLQDEIGPEFRIEEPPYRSDGGHEAHRAAYLAEQPAEALATIEKEALRRRKKRKAPQAELRILEPGLWSQLAGSCYSLELRLIEKQGSDFRLVAPDEPEARAAYEAEHPEQVDRRSDLLTSTAVIEMFPEEEEDNEEERDDDLDEEAVADLGEAEVNA
jgi:hypothetical protein